MKSIADRLGHSSPVTTLNTYAHISNKVAEKSMDSFEKYMEKLGQEKVCGQFVGKPKMACGQEKRKKRWSIEPQRFIY